MAELPKTELTDLQTRISELENLYAELFLDHGDRDQLKRIHINLEVLKQEVKQMGGTVGALL